MGIELDVLITKRYPPGDLYMPGLRTERHPLDPPYAAAPYTSILDHVVRAGEDMIAAVNRRWAAGFPARERLGQTHEGQNAFGSRSSPLNMPEEVRGRLVAASI